MSVTSSQSRKRWRGRLLIAPLLAVGAIAASSGAFAGASVPADPSGPADSADGTTVSAKSFAAAATVASRTVVGPTGQTLTVTPADGLAVDGAPVQVTGTGFDVGVGVYLALCVDNGIGVTPGPCLGGASMSGGAGASLWISSNPPPYAAGLTTPFTATGGFDVSLTLPSSDEFVDCLDGVTRCVVSTRADHTSPGNQTATVLLPVSFVGQDPIVDTPPDDDDGTGGTDDTTGGGKGTVPDPVVPAPTVPEPTVPAPTVPTGANPAPPAQVAGATDTNANATKKLAFTGSSTWWLTALAVVLIGSGFALTRITAAAAAQLRTQEGGSAFSGSRQKGRGR
ncbi:MAG TPA: hypothetical protein VL068_10975 [Microthrixaceae bacterium]|nr:hypothetical protein [Microthrixaceae bacterium]